MVRRRSAGRFSTMAAVVPPGCRRRTWRCAVALPTLSSARRTSKNAFSAPSARKRWWKPRGWVPAASSCALVRPSPSGSPRGAVVAGAGRGIEAELRLPGVGQAVGVGVVRIARAAGGCGKHVPVVVGVAGHEIGGQRVEGRERAVGGEVDELAVSVSLHAARADREASRERGSRLVEDTVDVGIAIAQEHVDAAVGVAGDEVGEAGGEEHIIGRRG